MQANPGPDKPSPGLREALEAALFANPDDLTTHMAYADWLAENGDPRGEFIQIQLGLEDTGQSAENRKALMLRETALLQQHGGQWLGPLAPFLLAAAGDDWQISVRRFRFSRGWLSELETGYLTTAFVSALREAPIARNLQMLLVPDVSRETEDEAVFSASAFCNLPCLANLRRFEVGKLTRSVWLNEDDDLVPIISAMGRVEEVRLYVGDFNVAGVFALPLPRLRVFYVHDLYEYPVEVLAANPSLRQLEQLSLWPHALRPGDEEAYITLDGLRALVHSPHLVNLQHLAVYLTDAGDAGCAEIVRSGILKRLRVLDLSRGRITSAWAKILAASPDLHHLDVLILDKNCLDSTGIKALEATGVSFCVENQWTPSGDEDDDEEYLYDGDME